tara:strand:- start:385 stop:564 length:180 start_codon:yes stop_codon:yes gene_type:complete
VTKDTIDQKIRNLDEQEEQLKVMFQKIQGAKEALEALKKEWDTPDTKDTPAKKKNEPVK